MRKYILLFSALLLFAACDKQRDLYDTASPLLRIEGNWVPSLDIQDMSNRATAMLYRGGDITKEFFYRPNNVTAKVSRGEYDILLFNGLMFSEENPNLDHIFFRNSANFEAFEAVVVEVAPNNRLGRAAGEYIASNDMEILTSAHAKVFVEGEKQYILKYKNGHNGFPTVDDYVESELQLIPFALSYYTQVVVHLVNPSSAMIANGALRGFVGSAFMASGLPSDFDVTHQFRLNNLKITNRGTRSDSDDPERGTIESPWFVTFGPPLNKADRIYTLELSIILKNGKEVNRTFDVTEQVNFAVHKILNHRQTAPTDIHIEITIPIEISLELEEVGGGDGSGLLINVNNWEDDEIIRVII